MAKCYSEVLFFNQIVAYKPNKHDICKKHSAIYCKGAVPLLFSSQERQVTFLHTELHSAEAGITLPKPIINPINLTIMTNGFFGPWPSCSEQLLTERSRSTRSYAATVPYIISTASVRRLTRSTSMREL